MEPQRQPVRNFIARWFRRAFHRLGTVAPSVDGRTATPPPLPLAQMGAGGTPPGTFQVPDQPRRNYFGESAW